MRLSGPTDVPRPEWDVYQLAEARIVGNGEMARLVRTYDWASTSIGPIESWSPELVAIVNLTLSSHLPAGTLWGPDLVLIYNDSYRSIPGRRDPDALGKPAREVYKEAWSVVGPTLEKAYTTGETFHLDKLRLPIETDSGARELYLDYSCSPVFENGRIAGLFGLLKDVTAEVLATRDLRESEARARRVLESIGDAVLVTDVDTCVISMNPVAERLTGWSLSEARNHRLDEVFRILDETTRQPIESPAEKVRRLGTVAGFANHTILVRRDGTEILIDDGAAPVCDENGRQTGIVLVFQDVTRQRKEAEALRDREARLNAMYSTSLEYIGLLTPEGTLLDCNSASLNFAGNMRVDVVGKHFAATPWFTGTPGGPELVHQAIACARSGETFRSELSLIRPNGDTLLFDFSLTPVRDANGTVLFLVPEGRDITGVKRTEAALLQSEKLAAVGRLAASIAHEINNPLESVMNLIYLARHAPPADAERYLETADQEIRRVSIIANQTLRFHKQASRPQAATSADLFSTVMSIYEGRLRNARVRVEKQFRTDAPVICFQGDVRQVLNNLVGNALEAMPLGGRLLIRSRKSRDWKSNKPGLVLTIADNGAGIPPAVQKNIFDAFFTTKGTAGNGLGLWVCQEIVNRHHGKLRVRSTQRPGRNGTTFTFFLPFDPACE
jgi:PAS domain S-box-containing protein